MPFFLFNGGYSELGSTHRLSDDAKEARLLPGQAPWGWRQPAEQKVVKGGG